MPVIFTLATRNLLHDRLRFIATVIGIVFSIVLVTIQSGLYLGFERTVTTMIDHAAADLWIVPAGTKCFEDLSLLDERARFDALAIKGVAEAVPVVIGFAQWRMPTGGATPVFVIGSDLRAAGLAPWNLVAGHIESLSIPGAIAIDQSYFDRLGVDRLGASAEIRGQKVEVAAVTKGIRSFTTTPYVFSTLDRARTYTGMSPSKATFVLVRTSPGADVEAVRRGLREQISDVEVLTPAEFGARSRAFWLFGTGAGAALFAGALLGMIVGTVIIAQTLYSSTKDHLNEFATLRAIGSSAGFIHKVIICQALLSAVIGFLLAYSVGRVVVAATAETTLPIVMTSGMSALLLMLTVIMCVISAIAAIVQVTRIDPVMAFSR
ncbi:MAG: multidrug ABC transporter substrate-binding protein [Proteobacteria bacterium]|nr:MAG: multidrug ABC transporter substrate-binding protein [Pseudomonadota bacterium]